MAGRRLTRGGRQGLALVALTLAVLAVHAWLLQGAQRWQSAWMPEVPEPERLQAAFVRELKPAAPPPPATPAKGDPGAPPPRPESRLKPSSLAGPAPMARDELALAPPPELEAPLVLPPALAASDLSGEWQPGIEWPLSTELSYRLTGFYRGAIYGQATVQWLRNGSHYQVHLESEIGPAIAPLMTRRMSSDGEITPQGLVPRRYDEHSGGLAGGGRRLTLLFRDGGVRLANGRQEPLPDGSQDAASQFVQLTWLFLTGRQRPLPDWRVDLPLALPRNVHQWVYRIRDLETVETPMGAIPAWHLDTAMDDTRGDMQVEQWLAPSLQFMPVRIRIWQNRAGGDPTHLDLVLRRPPLQAMAAEAVPAASAASTSAPL